MIPGDSTRMSSKTFIDMVAGLLAGIAEHDIESVGRSIQSVCDGGGTVYIAGNGGSAATALHFANDLHGAALRWNRHDLTPVCLCSNISTFSALSNDFGYSNVFVRQIEGRLERGDLLFLLSVSGNSSNCVEAARYARKMGVPVVSLLGSGGGELAGLSDQKILVDSSNCLAAESCHLVITHALTNWLEGGLAIESARLRARDSSRTYPN